MGVLNFLNRNNEEAEKLPKPFEQAIEMVIEDDAFPSSPDDETTSSGIVLRTDSLVKKYGKRTVVNHVSIDVTQGEIGGLLGPNGAGKTTTIGKMAALVKKQGKKVLLAAADTFRAGATEQLDVWAKRDGVDIVTGPENGDPAVSYTHLTLPTIEP